MKKTFFCLLIFVLFTSWLPQRIYLSLFQSGIFLLALWWLVSRKVRTNVPFAIWATFALPCFGVFQLLSAASVYKWETAGAVLEWSVIATVAWLSWQFAENADFERSFRSLLVLTGLTVSVLSVAHWYSSAGLIFWNWPDPYQLRTTFPLLNHSHFAAFTELAAAPAIWEALRERGPSQFYRWAAAIMICSVFAVGSRSGSVIVILELAVAIVLGLRESHVLKGLRRRSLTLATVVVVLIAGVGWQGIADRISAPPRSDLLPLFAGASLHMIQERPLVGFGLGTWATIYPAFAPRDIGLFVEHAHNDWLEWAAEGGIPFACVLIALAVFTIREARRRPWCLGVVAAFFQSLVEFPLHKPAVLAFQFAAIGCIAARRAASYRDEPVPVRGGVV